MQRVTNNSKSPIPLPCGTVVPAGEWRDVDVLDTGIPVVAAWVKAKLLTVQDVELPKPAKRRGFVPLSERPETEPTYPALNPENVLLSE